MLDIGCGTGTFACLLAERGIDVVGVEPAEASLAIARAKPVPGVGVVESWVDLLDVSLPLVSFRWTYRFEESGDVITSDSTLRFRSQEEVEQCVSDSGLVVVDVRDAPDRPGLEFVFVCRSEGDA